MKTKNKALLLSMCALLVVAAAIGGTLAWLTDVTDEVVNTFTVGKVDINLTETPITDTDGNGSPDAWKAQLIPGTYYAKDPKVIVKAGSEKCYLFVKFEVANNIVGTGEDAKNILSFTSNLAAPDWTQGDGANIPATVWYRTVEKDTADDTTYALLADLPNSGNPAKQVYVDPAVLTNETMPLAANTPTLTVNAD